MKPFPTQKTPFHVKSGFTLVEIIVVVAIIAVLALILFPILNEGRIKARDTDRVAHLEQLNLAIFLYRQANGFVPCPGTGGSDRYIDDQSHCLASALVPEFLPEIPTDPRYGGDGQAEEGSDVEYDEDTTSTYYVRVKMEGENHIQNATHPDGSTCQGGGFSQCSWYGEECIYVSGSDCDEYWLHLSKE